MTQAEKPTEAHRKELLNRLESIIKILNDKVEDSHTIPTLRETVDLSALTADEQVSMSSLNELLETESTPTDQPSLFEQPPNQTESSKKNHDRMDKTTPTKMENPFLPQHVRARLSSRERKAKASKSAGGEVTESLASSKDLHDSIIDNLIARYLPKIEADLRRQLKALAAKEAHGKKK